MSSCPRVRYTALSIVHCLVNRGGSLSIPRCPACGMRHAPFLPLPGILHSPFSIPHSPFSILHSPFSIPHSPILRVVTTVLLLATERPLAVRCDTLLRRSSERQVMERLVGLNVPDEDLTAMLRWVMPLLYQLDLLEIRNGRCRPTVAGHRFLARPAEEQRMRVQQAWIGLPDVEHWVQTRVLDARTMDLPFFRRRLCAWAASLPAQQWVAVDGLHATLEAAHGPLADAHTHRFRPYRRRPWNEPRSESLWEAALRGPLTWLGIVTWQSEERRQGAGERDQESHLTASPLDKVALVRSPNEVTPVEHPVANTTEADAAEVLPAPDKAPQPDATPPPWSYGAPGDVCIPHAHLDAQVLRLLPFVRWERSDATAATYRVSTDRIARAIRQGYSDTQLWTLLERQAGPLPAGWDDGLRTVPSRLHLHHQAIVMQNAECRMQNAGQMRNAACCMQHAACCMQHDGQPSSFNAEAQRRRAMDQGEGVGSYVETFLSTATEQVRSTR